LQGIPILVFPDHAWCKTMTVKTAELVMGVALAIISVAIMIKSAELNIGWVVGRGPGAGAWPFWLAMGMLLSSLATIVRWFLRVTPESRSSETFMSSDTVIIVGSSVGALLVLLIATHFVGLYVALFLFLFIYIKLIGRHSWKLTIALMIGVPVFIFCLFEWALQIPLPKEVTEPLFYPIYELMY
jgi:hypothetical protein